MSKTFDDASKTHKASLFGEDTSKLEWMYKSGSDLLNREEYLLGKTIDKQFEQLDDEEKKRKVLPGVSAPKNHVEHECIPYSIRNYRSLQNDEQVDIQRKILEDPLMAIRQKEMESRRRILENPVKLKELHRLLKHERETEKISKSSKKKSKKRKDKKQDKKRKKRKGSGSESDSESSDDEDLDKLLAKKYRQIKEKFGSNDGTFNLKELLGKEGEKMSIGDDRQKRNKRNASNDGSSVDGDDASDVSSSKRPRPNARKFHDPSKEYKFREKYKQKFVGRRRATSESSIESSRADRGTRRNHNNKDKANSLRPDRSTTKYADNNRHSDRVDQPQSSWKTQRKEKSPKRSSSSASPAHDNKMPPRKNFGLVTASGEKIDLKRSADTKYKSTHDRNEKEVPTKSTTTVTTQSWKTSSRVKLTDKEKERRCREMMANAEWREKERKTKVDNYRKEYDRETNDGKDFDKNFINKELHKAMNNQKSVESRIKSNINNIQRSGRAMDSNFAKR